jgi:leucyl aminopeptidase
MNIIEIFFINKNNTINIKIINKNINKIHIIINIYNLSNYEIFKLINKLNNIISIYDKIKQFNIKFDKNINTCSKILTKLNDIIYKYHFDVNKIKIYNVSNYCINLMNELFIYKDIVMNPNKNPDNYVKYVKSRIPSNYTYKLFNINKSNLFPLSKAVGMGSSYNSYFIHIYPKKILKNKKNIYMIGKAITYDSGGLNLKSQYMELMKFDMIGSSILISIINLIDYNKHNIHVLLPIVENMIGPNSIKPGNVIKTINNKTVEIINTDAEGRLCIVDAINYCNNIIEKNSIIIDIATLTGNTSHITGFISSICTTNDKGYEYYNKLANIGNKIGENVDYLKLREDYLDLLKSEVADIKSININYKFGCILAGAFINYFVNSNIPWIHIDLASCVYKNEKILSYGINLLYKFLINI